MAEGTCPPGAPLRIRLVAETSQLIQPGDGKKLPKASDPWAQSLGGMGDATEERGEAMALLLLSREAEGQKEGFEPQIGRQEDEDSPRCRDVFGGPVPRLVQHPDGGHDGPRKVPPIRGSYAP